MNSVGASSSNLLGLVSRAWRLATILPALLLVCCTCAFPLDPSLDISQYAHTAWKMRDGFVQGPLTSIGQTPDGYLWLGTEFGLLRFDGVRAVPWQPPSGQRLPSNYINSLLVARDGSLWIGTHNGLASWKDGKLTEYPELAESVIFSLAEDREGVVWAATWAIGASPLRSRLCAVQNSQPKCFDSFQQGIEWLYQDSKGSLWVGGTDGLWRWKPGPPQHLDTSRTIRAIEDESGNLLVAEENGFKRVSGGRVESYILPGIDWHATIRAFRSSDGSLWFGTGGRGLIHVHRGRVDMFATPDGLSGNFVYSVFEDREGNVWVGTNGGLDRFRDVAVPTISSRQGLADDTVWSVLASRNGSLWLGSPSGVNHWTNGDVTIYRKRQLLEHDVSSAQPQPQPTKTVREVKNSGLPGRAESLFEDDAARVWVSTTQSIVRWDGRRFAPVNGIPGQEVYSMAEDHHGSVWIASQEHGLFRVPREGEVEQFPWSRLGRGEYALSVAIDPSQDGVWLGFARGGIAYWEDGQIRTSYSVRDGLSRGDVSALRFGSRGALWAAAEGGLSRIKDGHIATLTSKNGLPCDSVHWSIEDDDHAVWLYLPCGLVRIERSDMDAWAADPKRMVHPTVFDVSDGVTPVDRMGGWGPHVSKSLDGRLWFASYEGVSYVDPHHLPFNKLPPPVHIDDVIADGKTYDPTQGQRLPAHSRDVTIDYTALSLTIPEKVRFRVRLEGQDKDWREVVNVRQVHYTNLPPRHYQFRVIAANNSGVWNEAGDSLDFDIPPAWYQTMWFRAICIAAFMALLWAIYQLRVRQLQEQEKKFRDAVETMPALAFVADPNGNRTFFNRGWLEYTGLSSEQALGSGWEKAIHPDDLKRVTERWLASRTTGQPLDYEVRLRRGSDGDYRWFQVRAKPLRDRQGKVLKWCAVASDIEDRKQAERLQADLTHLNRVSTMGELVASISHELAQPIMVTTADAKASLRWLQRDPPELTEVRKGTERILEAGTLAAGIIDRLRSLYKKTPPKRELVALNEVIDDMTRMLRSEARGHGISIRTDLTDDLPMTLADRVQLQQVLMNLMLNGIEAMGETGGVLTVKSQLSDDRQIQISVNDTGPGLPPGKADQLFEPFFTMKPQGSGMGLAICKSIVESHCGRIWAGENGGRGATFHFTLPGAPAENAPFRGYSV